MALSKVKIGSFVEPYNEACGIAKLTPYDVSGINRDKEFFEPSKQVGADTSKYKVVPPDHFACNLMHVGRDVVLPIALNHSGKKKYVSPAYTVFRIKDETIILKEYFFLLLNSKEQDRYFWFHTDSSVRDGMEWAVFCDLEIEIPDISIQKKYVDIHHNMQENLYVQKQGVIRMQRTCEAYLEKLTKTTQLKAIGTYIEQTDERNSSLTLGLESVRGITTQKEFIPTKANMSGVSLDNYKIVHPGYFAYVADTSRRGDKISLAYNGGVEDYLVSSITTTFQVKKDKRKELLSDYLFMFLRRTEFDRYARYNSWGSARETITWEDLGRLRIPIPPMGIQQDIVSIFHVINERNRLTERLVSVQKNICPILVRGAIEEGGR